MKMGLRECSQIIRAQDPAGGPRGGRVSSLTVWNEYEGEGVHPGGGVRAIRSNTLWPCMGIKFP